MEWQGKIVDNTKFKREALNRLMFRLKYRYLWKYKRLVSGQHLWGKICQLFGYCYLHGWGHKVERFRMHTAYVDAESNYTNGCELCREEVNAHWDEMWRDYYSSRF